MAFGTYVMEFVVSDKTIDMFVTFRVNLILEFDDSYFFFTSCTGLHQIIKEGREIM